MRHSKPYFVFFVLSTLFLLALSACGGSFSPFATPTPTATFTPLPPTETLTPTVTNTPTITLTPTITDTPTITPTPTFDFPDVTTKVENGFCRYGPGTAYLYSHGLVLGDRGEVHGRTDNGAWLWVKPDNLDRRCWAAASLFDIEGDIFTVVPHESALPQSTLYGPVPAAYATRNGVEVKVSWEEVWMTKDDFRGYMIEAVLCQGGFLIEIAVQTDRPRYTFTDEPGCPLPSSALLYAVEKHGYTDPIQITWPPAQ